jgi:hypothetical protein
MGEEKPLGNVRKRIIVDGIGESNRGRKNGVKSPLKAAFSEHNSLLKFL